MGNIKFLILFCVVCVASNCAKIHKYEEIDTSQKSIELARNSKFVCFGHIKKSLEDNDWDVYVKYRNNTSARIDSLSGSVDLEVETSVDDASGVILDDNSPKKSRLAKVSKNKRIPRYKLAQNYGLMSVYDQKHYKLALDIENYSHYQCEEIANLLLKSMDAPKTVY